MSSSSWMISGKSEPFVDLGVLSSDSGSASIGYMTENYLLTFLNLGFAFFLKELSTKCKM